MNYLEFLSEWEVPGFAARVALGGIVISTAVLLAARALRRRSEPMRYGVLFAGVVGLLAVPMLVVVGQRYQESIVAAAPMEVEVVKIPAEMLDAFLNQPEVDEEAPAEAARMNDPWQWAIASLLTIWGLGTLVGTTRLLVGLCKLRRVLLGPAWQQPFWTTELQAQLALKLGLKKFPDVRVSPAAPMPMVVGILRPTIVLPENAPASWQQPQWEAVLLHEAAHIARRDPWAALLQHVAVLLFWWCPLVHMMSRRLNDLRESICDDCALQGKCDHLTYVELLVDSAERFIDAKPVPVPLGLLESARGGLEARVLRLLEKERKPMIKLSLAGKLLGATCLVAACMLATAATAFSQAQAQPGKKVQIKILVDGKEIDLSDLKILQALETGKKEENKDVYEYKIQVKPLALPTVEAKGITFSPDGKLIVTTDGKTVTVLDAATGKIVAKHDTANAQVMERYVTGKAVTADPRIEELVKLAEKIKPGSGADVRKALQSSTTQNWYGRVHTVPATPMTPPVSAVPALPGVPGVKVIEAGGKKIVILSIEEGKVQQLNEADLKKLIEKAHSFKVDVDFLKKVDPAKKFEIELKSPISIPKLIEKKVEKKTTTTPPPAPDLDALKRQLDRINAEIRDLRKRLEDSKK